MPTPSGTSIAGHSGITYEICNSSRTGRVSCESGWSRTRTWIKIIFSGLSSSACPWPSLSSNMFHISTEARAVNESTSSTRCRRRRAAGSTWNTPSGCSSRSWAGPPPRSAALRPPTGGPGRSSPPIPSSGSPAAGQRPAPPVGTPLHARPAYSCPGPPRIPEPPRKDRLPRQCTKARQGRPRAPARVKEPPPRSQLRGRQDLQTGTHPQSHPRTRRLNGKLRLRRPKAAADSAGRPGWPGRRA